MEPKLVRGKGGIFDVLVDDEMIYSKHETGRFPSEDEIIQSIRTRQEESA